MEQKPTILIVDDEALGRESLEALLFKENYNLIFAENGFEALEKAKQYNPDLVLLDIMMPKMDGFEVCRKMREDKILAEIPIILVTALDDRDSKITGLEAGTDDFISKPFDRLELRARVRAITRLNRYRTLLNERSEKEIIKAQKDIIENQKKDIVDSINYAKRIQTAALPPLDYINKIIPQNFILYKPKDIVSGDFYFVAEKNNKIIVAVADCTGHGVPGAFLSMLGLSFLNDIVNNEKYLESNLILDKLKEKNKNALNQPHVDENTYDGMDIALMVFDRENKKLQYSGANNALYILRKNGNISEEPADNIELIILKPDSFSIGMDLILDHEQFKKQEVDLQKDDIVYLFSDGYADQFGGQKDKKFNIKKFREKLKSIHTLPMEDQKNILDQAHKEWKGEQEQIDDILVMGIRF